MNDFYTSGSKIAMNDEQRRRLAAAYRLILDISRHKPAAQSKKTPATDNLSGAAVTGEETQTEKSKLKKG
jgi:hypothetical protein